MNTDKAISILNEMLTLEKQLSVFPNPDNADRIAVLEFAMEKLRGYENAVTALKEINKYNDIGNDLRAYLFHVAEWGMGDKREKPNTNDYGIIE